MWPVEEPVGGDQVVASLLGQVVEEVPGRAEGEQVVAGLLHQLADEVVEVAAEEPVTRWGCEDCGKEFRQRRQLYLHARHNHVEPGV